MSPAALARTCSDLGMAKIPSAFRPENGASASRTRLRSRFAFFLRFDA